MPTGSERSLRMLATALEGEERGRDFYKEAVDKCANELGKDIFRTLTIEEGIHIKRVKEIYDSLQRGEAWTGKWKEYKLQNENLEQLFKERIRKLGPGAQAGATDLEALEVGLGFEQSAIKFYEQELASATDPLEKEFIQRMILEEHAHYASLADVKLYLTNPQAYFIEHERHTLDGA